MIEQPLFTQGRRLLDHVGNPFIDVSVIVGRSFTVDDLVETRVRVLDPYVRAFDRWLLRRLAPDCSRIEMSSLPAKRDEQRLLYAMGWETANIHLGGERAIANVKRDLRRRKGNWLHRAAKEMVQAVRHDWTEWGSTK